jgi:hypothetical protein
LDLTGRLVVHLYLVANHRRPGRSNQPLEHIPNALTIHYGDHITNINH